MRHTEETLVLHENLEENRRLCYRDFTTFYSKNQQRTFSLKQGCLLQHQKGNWHCSKSYRARRLYITWLVVDKLESMESLRLGKCGHTPLATDKEHLHACTTKDHYYLQSITKQWRFLGANWLIAIVYIRVQTIKIMPAVTCTLFQQKINSILLIHFPCYCKKKINKWQFSIRPKGVVKNLG